jgi:hypothetical protein
MSTIVESPAAALRRHLSSQGRTTLGVGAHVCRPEDARHAGRVTSTVCGSEVLLSLRVRWYDSGWLEDLEPHELVMVPC